MMLEMHGIHTYYGDSHVLQGVTLEVKKGMLAALLGRNGMGKTTTMHTIMGFTPPEKGRIMFEGKDITALPPHEIARRGISLVPQGRRIFKSLTVKENLILGMRKERPGYGLEKIYEWFPVLEKRAKNLGEQISGGEQQMLAFARALMADPKLILMDEPFEGLAPEIVKDLCRIIGQLISSGVSILLVEQNMQAALRLADYVYIMNKGRIVHEGAPQEVREEEEVVKRYMTV